MSPSLVLTRSPPFSHLRRGTIVHQLLLRFPELSAELCIARKPLARDLARLDCGRDGTTRLGKVGAVVEATLADKRPELRKARVEILRRHSPHPDLSQAGRIHYVAGVRERMQHRPYCR